MNQKKLAELMERFSAEFLAPRYAPDTDQREAASEAANWFYEALSEESTERFKPSDMSQESRADLLQLTALKALLQAQNFTIPTYAFGQDVQRDLHLSIHQLEAEIEALEKTGQRTGLDSLQQAAIAQYGDYGILIESLRDAANGKLPDMFTALGNLLARYRDLPPENRDLESWIWTLESMKSAVHSELEKQKQELYARRGV